MRLGAMLREYDIRSANIRFGEPIGQAKGYYRADFTDAWARYCPPTRRGSRTSRTSRPRPAQTRYGSTTGTAQAVPPKKPYHALTSDGTTGTTGTATPRYSASTAVPA